MTNSTAATIDPHAKITVQCNEPNCKDFENGHEIFACMDDGLSFIHERPENYGVTVQRFPDVAVWDIEVGFEGELSVAEAQRLINALTAAIEDVTQLNAVTT